jgi:DNA-binding CsgD family transcriptional regulator
MGHIRTTGIVCSRLALRGVRQVFDVARRRRNLAETRQHQLERSLDWLADGVALLRADGAILYANESLQVIARRADGIRLGKGELEFSDPQARERLAAALAAVVRLKIGELGAGAADFIALRAGQRQPYLVSLRPLVAGGGGRSLPNAVAIVFVGDPGARGVATIGTLRELFGLTEAEAALACALQGGISVGEYARAHGLSLNTIYTHLRRLREKTRCRRMPELIHKLNELQVPLRRN